MINLGDFTTSDTLYVPFATYDSNGASVTLTGLATTDIEIYKNGVATTRASDSGYTLLDTDGIDFAGHTGVHGFSIDLSDNTDVGFYVPGVYFIVVDAVTVDSQTVRGLFYFTIKAGTLADIDSGVTAIETKASDTHSRLVVVETAIDSDQTSRTTAIAAVKTDTSDTHSRLVVVEASIDSDQTSRATAIAAVKSDTTAIETKASDTHSRLVVVETAIDSDQTSRTTAISDVKSELTKTYSDTTRIELSLVTATGALEATPSSTVLQTDLPELTDNHYNNMVFVMTSGDEAGEARRIDSYTGSTGTVTLKTALSGAPTAAETFAILNIPVYGDVLASDLAVIETKTSDTHSRLVVVETAIDSDQTSRTAAISAVKSRLVVVESAIDSDQTSRATAISDVKSHLVVVQSETTVIQSQTTVIEGVVPKQNTALNNIEFLFVAASDHVTPVTGATGMAVTRSIDGGAFGSGTGTGPAEVGNGIYQYDASAADLNGGTITFRFTATGGTPGAPDDAFITFHTSGAQ